MQLLPEVLDELKFQFFDNVAYPYTVLPYREEDGITYNVPLLGVTAVGHSGPVGDNPIRAVGNYSAGVPTWRNISGRTISGLMRGSIEMLVRVQSQNSQEHLRRSGLAPNRPPNIWFCLNSDNDYLNARESYAMAICSNWGQIPMFKLFQQQWGVPIPEWADLAPLLSGVTPKAHTVEVGYIGPNSVAETLTPADGNGRTTSWMEVDGETLWHVAASGTSNIARLQFRDAGGRIWYDHRQSGGGLSVDKVWQIHPEAVEARICFANVSAATATDITVLPVPNTIDPCVGTWAKYQFNINQHVDLLPNVDYEFQVRFFNGAGGAYDRNSFVITTGGLSLLHDGRSQRYLNVEKMKGTM